MSIVKVRELNSEYNDKTAVKIEESVATLSKLLSNFILRNNVKVENKVVVGLCEDYRTGARVLFSRNDDTSPRLELDLGLLKNSQYTVPYEIQAQVKERMVVIIQNLTELGYTVTPVEAWTKQYEAYNTEDSHINVVVQLNPVECFEIGWSNA